jgi:DNA-binding Xre family transcriptional regulator
MRAKATAQALYRQYKIGKAPKLQVRLRQALDSHRKQTGKTLTYGDVAKLTGLSYATVASLATRPTYNTRLSTIAKLCDALGCAPGELLGLVSAGGQHDGQR